MESYKWIISHQRVFWHSYIHVMNILIFVLTSHKFLQHASNFFNWHQIIYLCNMRVLHRLFSRSATSCACRVWIGGSLTNFTQQFCPWKKLKIGLIEPATGWEIFNKLNTTICSLSKNDVIWTIIIMSGN